MIDNKCLEEVAAEIALISDAMKRVDAGPLKRRAVVLLLSDVTKLNRTDINLVLDGMRDLADIFLEPKEDGE